MAAQSTPNPSFKQHPALRSGTRNGADDVVEPDDLSAWSRTIRLETRHGRAGFVVSFELDGGLRAVLCGNFPVATTRETLRGIAHAEAVRWERHLAAQPIPLRQTARPNARSAFPEDRAHRKHHSFTGRRRAA